MAAKRVWLQLDYFMSSQFAGVALARSQGVYKAAGVDLQLRPNCPPGLEAQEVLKGFAADSSGVWAGTMEQNTLVPEIQAGCDVKAVAAMFGQSPLCLALRPGESVPSGGLGEGLVIGAHEDTVELIKRILPKSEVVICSREEKLAMLLAKKIDAVQVYDVMETLRLREDMGADPVVASFQEAARVAGSGEVNLGYAQVVFSPTAQLQSPEDRSTLQQFLGATFEGWRRAIRDPKAAALEVMRQQDPGQITGHWLDTEGFTERSVQLCCEYVKASSRANVLGTIDARKWKSASEWLVPNAQIPAAQTLEPHLWALDSKFMVGHDVAAVMRREVREAAAVVTNTRGGRRPVLVVITIGDSQLGYTHADGPARRNFFAPSDGSWFSKYETGNALGIDVREIVLPEDVSQERLLLEIRRHRDADGVQVMWPLPAHIDNAAVLDAIPLDQDVDGVHYVGQMEVAGGHVEVKEPSVPPMPVTPAAVMHLLSHYEIDVAGKRVLVVGRSRLVGQPLAYVLTSKNAVVTVAHSGTEKTTLQQLCGEADILIPCVGVPGLIEASWVKEGAVVVNVGTTFNSETLLPDISDLGAIRNAQLLSSCPGGVGPLVVVTLFKNVVSNAQARGAWGLGGATAETKAMDYKTVLQWLHCTPGWSVGKNKNGVPVLHRTFRLESYPVAMAFLDDVMTVADSMNHHPNVEMVHHCTAGIDITLEVFTYAITDISEVDFRLVTKINQVYDRQPQQDHVVPDLKMKEFEYHLPEELIAHYPANPRGSSRLLVVYPEPNANPVATHVQRTLARPPAKHVDLTFSDLVTILPSDCHLVFNESKVFCARVFASFASGEAVEVMFLSSEEPSPDPAVCLHAPCHAQVWRVMIRSAEAVPGTTLTVETTIGSQPVTLSITVDRLYSAWDEEGEADGVEAAVVVSATAQDLPMADVFDAFGSVPLPPYMRREVEPADRGTYQTVYAKEEGSVAAPTAGLHFTPDILQQFTAKGIRRTHLVLHVSAGTFRPVTAERIAEHPMHEEMFAVPVSNIEEILVSLEAGRPIVPVGTTSVRVLETLYWIGARSLLEDAPPSPTTTTVGQWEPFHVRAQLQKGGKSLPSAQAALQSLVSHMRAFGEPIIRGSTSICIVPGYPFQLCDALITNFHQPDSTLLLLVSALMGGAAPLLNAYAHAVENKYRFLSFGDACLLFNVASQRSTGPAAPSSPSLHSGTGGPSAQGPGLSGGGMQASGDMVPDIVEAASGYGPRTAAAAATAKSSATVDPQGKVLLHSCCAPCSGAMIEEMQQQGLDVTVFFYNPNIHPKEEYEIRKEENKRFADELGIPFVDADYDADEWFRRAKGMEFCPERGTRCSMCFDMRFERTALYAAEHGFGAITTTNATSRWKDADQVNESGIKAAQKYDGIQWWLNDWATEEMSKRKYRINADMSFYKQEYCGCSYSLRDTNQYRKKEGLPPVSIGGDNYYSDPEKDSEEESLEAVAQFFEDTNSEEQERRRQIREMYRQRRKDARRAEGNNW